MELLDGVKICRSHRSYHELAIDALVVSLFSIVMSISSDEGVANIGVVIWVRPGYVHWGRRTDEEGVVFCFRGGTSTLFFFIDCT